MMYVNMNYFVTEYSVVTKEDKIYLQSNGMAANPKIVFDKPGRLF